MTEVAQVAVGRDQLAIGARRRMAKRGLQRNRGRLVPGAGFQQGLDVIELLFDIGRLGGGLAGGLGPGLVAVTACGLVSPPSLPVGGRARRRGTGRSCPRRRPSWWARYRLGGRWQRGPDRGCRSDSSSDSSSDLPSDCLSDLPSDRLACDAWGEHRDPADQAQGGRESPPRISLRLGPEAPVSTGWG